MAVERRCEANRKPRGNLPFIRSKLLRFRARPLLVSDGFRSASILLSHLRPIGHANTSGGNNYLSVAGRPRVGAKSEAGSVIWVSGGESLSHPRAALALFALQIYSGFSGGGKTRRYPYGVGTTRPSVFGRDHSTIQLKPAGLLRRCNASAWPVRGDCPDILFAVQYSCVLVRGRLLYQRRPAALPPGRSRTKFEAAKAWDDVARMW
jgi:hypothetical protein